MATIEVVNRSQNFLGIYSKLTSILMEISTENEDIFGQWFEKLEIWSKLSIKNVRNRTSGYHKRDS